jgi:Rrf2 family protein
MLLSKACEYGIRAALFIASTEEDDSYVSIREISDKLDIPYHFLAKILQKLTNTGLLKSMKGPNGGVRFEKHHANIQLFEIVTAIDGDKLFTECILGLPGCGRQKPCALHQHWMIHREGIKNMLNSTTLKELAGQTKAGKFRMKPEALE